MWFRPVPPPAFPKTPVPVLPCLRRKIGFTLAARNRASLMQLAELEPRPNRPLPIRITPLIDVVFILLVFFMLTTRLMPVDYLELGNDTASRSSVTGMPLPELQVRSEERRVGKEWK